MRPGKPLLHTFMVTPSKGQKKTLRMLVLVLPFPSPPPSPLPLILLPFLAFLAARQSLIKSRKKGGGGRKRERSIVGGGGGKERRKETHSRRMERRAGQGADYDGMPRGTFLSASPLLWRYENIGGIFSPAKRWLGKEMNSFALCRLSPFKAAVAEAKRNLSLCCCIKMRLFNRSSGVTFFGWVSLPFCSGVSLPEVCLSFASIQIFFRCHRKRLKFAVNGIILLLWCRRRGHKRASGIMLQQ